MNGKISSDGSNCTKFLSNRSEQYQHVCLINIILIHNARLAVNVIENLKKLTGNFMRQELDIETSQAATHC